MPNPFEGRKNPQVSYAQRAAELEAQPDVFDDRVAARFREQYPDGRVPVVRAPIGGEENESEPGAGE